MGPDPDILDILWKARMLHMQTTTPLVELSPLPPAAATPAYRPCLLNHTTTAEYYTPSLLALTTVSDY